MKVSLSLTVAMITLLFVITWLPLFALSILATFNPEVLPLPSTSTRLLHFVKCMHFKALALTLVLKQRLGATGNLFSLLVVYIILIFVRSKY